MHFCIVSLRYLAIEIERNRKRLTKYQHLNMCLPVDAQGTMEMLLSGAICGTVYAFFSGQPLTIIGATGPLLIFESIIYQLCK